MRYVYTSADTIKKREFVSMVFDNNLYYQDGIYRIPTMMDMLAHNSLLMKEKGYLIYEKKGMILQSSLPAERKGITNLSL
jgi:site-specific DNA recombinase